jgi:hypothetical protein
VGSPGAAFAIAFAAGFDPLLLASLGCMPLAAATAASSAGSAPSATTRPDGAGSTRRPSNGAFAEPPSTTTRTLSPWLATRTRAICGEPTSIVFFATSLFIPGRSITSRAGSSSVNVTALSTLPSLCRWMIEPAPTGRASTPVSTVPACGVESSPSAGSPVHAPVAPSSACAVSSSCGAVHGSCELLAVPGAVSAITTPCGPAVTSCWLGVASFTSTRVIAAPLGSFTAATWISSTRPSPTGIESEISPGFTLARSTTRRSGSLF